MRKKKSCTRLIDTGTVEAKQMYNKAKLVPKNADAVEVHCCVVYCC